MATTMHAQGGVERLQVNEKSNLVTFTQVVENPSKDKTALFSAVKTWIATTYNSAKTVTDLADENTGKFILKPVAILPLNATVRGLLIMLFEVMQKTMNGNCYHKTTIRNIKSCF